MSHSLSQDAIFMQNLNIDKILIKLNSIKSLILDDNSGSNFRLFKYLQAEE